MIVAVLYNEFLVCQKKKTIELIKLFMVTFPALSKYP